MTWGEFKSAVRVHLVAHARRQGIQDLIDSLIKAGCWDLQASIDAYRGNTRRTLTPTSLRAVGFAASGVVPVGTRIVAAFSVDPADDSKRVPYSFAETDSDVLDMEEGNMRSDDKWLYHDFRAGKILLSPSPKEDMSNTLLVLDAKQLDFDDNDDVPFDTQTALVVGDYVKAHLARDVDHDVATAQSYNASFAFGKRVLRSELNPVGTTPK